MADHDSSGEAVKARKKSRSKRYAEIGGIATVSVGSVVRACLGFRCLTLGVQSCGQCDLADTFRSVRSNWACAECQINQTCQFCGATHKQANDPGRNFSHGVGLVCHGWGLPCRCNFSRRAAWLPVIAVSAALASPFNRGRRERRCTQIRDMPWPPRPWRSLDRSCAAGQTVQRSRPMPKAQPW